MSTSCGSQKILKVLAKINGFFLRYHFKKQRCFTEPSKKVPEMSKSVESLKKRIKISTKLLKVLPVYPSEEPSHAKPFFKFRTAGKGFVGK
jgi:hypothetical protein